MTAKPVKPIYDRKRLDLCDQCEWCEDGVCTWEQHNEGMACVYYHDLLVKHAEGRRKMMTVRPVNVTDPRD